MLNRQEHQVIVLLLLQYVSIYFVTAEFKLTVLHANDIHSRFEQTNKYSGICKPKNAGENRPFHVVFR